MVSTLSGMRGGQKGAGPEALKACDCATLITTTSGPGVSGMPLSWYLRLA